LENTLYFGDNLPIIREFIKDETIDLIYLDPPFNSKANYNVIFKAPKGEESAAQITAFEDTWHWHTGDTEFEFNQLVKGGGVIAEVMKGLELVVGKNDLLAYLTMMAIRLRELYRVLKDTGSLYLHCDPTASHYLKIILDAIFEAKNFRNEIIWKRTSAHNDSKRFGRIHDIILFYSKTENYIWNKVLQPYSDDYVKKNYKFSDEKGNYASENLTGAGVTQGNSSKPWKNIDPSKVGRHWAVPLNNSLPDWFIYPKNWKNMNSLDRLDILHEQQLIIFPKKKNGKPRFKKYLNESSGNGLQDLILDISPLSSHAKERMGYPTQKPVALLERIIKASSSEGDIALDPFCGCGTAIIAAQKLKRNWIGIDVTHLAIHLMEERMKKEFAIKPKVIGNPASFNGAENLFKRNPLDFERWAVTRIDGIHPNKKQTGDRGIDGKGYLGPNGEYKTLVSVKGGKQLNPGMVRDLVGTVTREEATFGVLITIHQPTSGMQKEAVVAGLVDIGLSHYPKIQIWTIADFFNGKKPNLPY